MSSATKSGSMRNPGRRWILRFSSFRRVLSVFTLPFARNLAKLGIEASVRVIDIPQYIERLNQFDFDMVVG